MAVNLPSTSSSHSSPSVPSNGQQFSDFNNQILKGMMAGVLAAAISKSAVAPMDRVKLILQLQDSLPAPSASVASNGTVQLMSCQQQPYQGTLDCFRRVCAEQGVRSLWRGNSATVLRCLPNQALNLAFRDHFRVAFLNGIDRKRRPIRFVFGNLVAGGVGGVLTLVIVYPLDFARTRLAVASPNRFPSIFHCFRDLFAAEGFAGFYRGFCPALLHTFASRAIFFGIFDSIRLSMMEQRQRPLSFFFTWSLAQVSIIISSLLCYPLDTIRRRLMMEVGEPIKRYRTQMECWQGIVRTEGGVPALYRGALTNSLRCTSGALILALYYEMLKHF